MELLLTPLKSTGRGRYWEYRFLHVVIPVHLIRVHLTFFFIHLFLLSNHTHGLTDGTDNIRD